MRAALISVMVFFLYLPVTAQIAKFYGIVKDEQGSPIAFVSVWFDGADKGTATNENGVFSIDIHPGKYTVTLRHIGYVPFSHTLLIDGKQAAENIELHALDVKKSEGADSIVRLVIARRRTYSDSLPHYAGRLYTRELQQLDGAPRMFLKKDVAHQLNISENRKGIFSLSESMSTFQTRKTDFIKEDVIAKKLTADSNAFGFNSAADLHINLYRNTLLLKGLCEHAFLSPIASNAFHFYRYTLVSTFKDEDRLIYAISVKPKHKNEHLFSGTIYVVDKEWCLYAADLHLTHTAHIDDFVDSVEVQQQFVPVKDGNLLPQDMTLRFYGGLLLFKYSGYFFQLYQDVSRDTTVKKIPDREVYHSDATDYLRDDNFWNLYRPVSLLPNEERFYELADLAQRHKKDNTLADSLQNTNNRFNFIPYFFNGYTLHSYRNNSLWSFPAPYTIPFYNTVEGYGFNVAVKYKKIYEAQHSLTIVPDVRYGFTDRVFNSNVFADYIYNPFRQASVYGRVGSDFLDLNNQGTISPFLNSLTTLFSGDNYLKLYQSKFIMAGTTGEVANGVLLNGQFEYAERHSLFNNTLHTFNKDSVYLTSNNPLDPFGDTPLFPAYRALVFQGSATFTFDQQYKITSAGKFIMPNPYPRVRLNFREGIPELGSVVNYSFVSVDVFQDRVNMGIYGYSAYFVSAGFFPNKRSLYYPDYMQFSGGQSFFFNAYLGGFHFLNYYTYSTDHPYFEAHLEHNFCGFFLSHVPLLNKLNLQEIVGGSFLNQGQLPDYEEVYFGLKRSVVRLDYGFAFGRFNNRIQGFRLSFNF